MASEWHKQTKRTLRWEAQQNGTAVKVGIIWYYYRLISYFANQYESRSLSLCLSRVLRFGRIAEYMGQSKPCINQSLQ